MDVPKNSADPRLSDVKRGELERIRKCKTSAEVLELQPGAVVRLRWRGVPPYHQSPCSLLNEKSRAGSHVCSQQQYHGGFIKLPPNPESDCLGGRLKHAQVSCVYSILTLSVLQQKWRTLSVPEAYDRFVVNSKRTTCSIYDTERRTSLEKCPQLISNSADVLGEAITADPVAYRAQSTKTFALSADGRFFVPLTSTETEGMLVQPACGLRTRPRHGAKACSALRGVFLNEIMATHSRNGIVLTTIIASKNIFTQG